MNKTGTMPALYYETWNLLNIQKLSHPVIQDFIIIFPVANDHLDFSFFFLSWGRQMKCVTSERHMLLLRVKRKSGKTFSRQWQKRLKINDIKGFFYVKSQGKRQG